jgi:DNA polymerase-3 subunit delta'
MAFASVLGHDRAKALLSRAVARDRLPPALLLAGPEGVGKKTLALELARAVVCERRGEEACGECSSCRRITRASETLGELRQQADERPNEPLLRNYRLHPDLMLVEPGRTRVRWDIKIEQIRQLVREIAGRPFEGRARAFVIDAAHAMTEQAANALLKSLEEPTPTSHVVLVTASPQALLPTIRSRCQLLRLNPLPAPLLEGHLRTVAGLSSEEARLRAVVSAGSLGRALAFESETYRSLREQLLDLLDSLPALGELERLEAAERLSGLEEPALALLTLRGLLRDVAALRCGSDPLRLLNPDVAGRLGALAAGPLGPRARELAEAVADTRKALAANANRLLAMDLLVDAAGLTEPLPRA